LNLTPPPSAEFDTAQELLRYCNNYTKQNSYALATKNSKREKKGKLSQSNLILEQNTEKLKEIQLQKNEGKHRLGSTIVHLKYMAKNVDGKWRFVFKVPNHNHPASPPEAHPMHQCLDDTGDCCGHFVVRGMDTTPRPVLNAPDLW